MAWSRAHEVLQPGKSHAERAAQTDRSVLRVGLYSRGFHGGRAFHRWQHSVFNESTAYAATWLFLVGSIFFGLRPTTTLLREVAYVRAGKYQDVGET
ncbi:MAG: YrhK family protein [Gammaproteobacteria bacterium]